MVVWRGFIVAMMEIKLTPIRVVCQNTLTMAPRQGPTLHTPLVILLLSFGAYIALETVQSSLVQLD